MSQLTVGDTPRRPANSLAVSSRANARFAIPCAPLYPESETTRLPECAGRRYCRAMSHDPGQVGALSVDVKKQLLAEAHEQALGDVSGADLLLFLRARRVPEVEAQEFVDRSWRERLRLIREHGTKKYRIGCVLILLPTLYNLIATSLGKWNALIFLPLAAVGTVGIWKVANGLRMVIKPEKVRGHVYEIMR